MSEFRKEIRKLFRKTDDVQYITRRMATVDCEFLRQHNYFKQANTVELSISDISPAVCGRFLMVEGSGGKISGSIGRIILYCHRILFDFLNG